MRRRTVALRQIVLVDAARRIHAAPLVLARTLPVAHAHAPGQRVARAAGRTLAAHRTVRLVPAHRIRSARVRLAAGRTVARHPRIARLSRRAQALRPSVHHTAQRVTAASAVLQAGIPAQARIASLLGRTLFVRRALVHLARSLRILRLAIRTRTVRAMVGDATRHPHIAARLVAQTRVQAQPVDARPLRRTVLMGSTAGHAGAALAQLPGRTGARIALGAALAVRALLAARALRVVAAGVRTEGALFVALAVRVALLQRLRAAVEAVANHAGRTAALHRMIFDRALGARTAHRPRLRTRIGALLLDARQMAGALAVRAASRHTGQILADVPLAAFVVAAAHWLADAALAALVADALRVGATGRSTQVVRAAEAARTVGGRGARRRRRADAAEGRRWVGHHAVQAGAAGPMVGHRADGVRAARGGQAGVGAGVVAARLAGTAVAVVVAGKDALVVQADVAEEAVVVDATGHCGCGGKGGAIVRLHLC